MFHLRSSNFSRKLRKRPTKCSNFQVLILCMFIFWSISNIVDTSVQPINSNCQNFLVSASVLRHLISEDGMHNSSLTFNWSYTVSNINSLNHSLYGNRKRLGYKLAFWNCRKGLINKSGCRTTKVIDVKRFVEKNKPHVFGILETDRHSPSSRLVRRTVVTKSQVEDQLKIEGYKIELPCISRGGKHGL